MNAPNARGMSPTPIVVIELFPAFFDCQGCGEQVPTATAWPYYEDFLHPDDPNPERGYAPACDACAAKLAARFKL